MITQDEKAYSQIFDEMVSFLRSLGITVNTKTKARGHQGFYLKNRIDISANIDYKRKIEVLIHEFTHYIHSKIDTDIHKTHGTLDKLFPNADIKKIEEELLKVTRFVDKNKGYSLLMQKRQDACTEIKNLDKSIKETYPDFKRSYPYPAFDKIVKKSDAKYLLKYDRVIVKTTFFGKTKEYSIKNIDEDFPELSQEIRTYIKIKSGQRALKRISSRLNRLDAYYKRATELFARFVEGLFIDTNKISEIAPYTYLVFCKELACNRYLELADFINKFF